MNKTFLFSIALFLASSIQAQDIFKKHGFEKETLTLSKGRYEEVFTNKEIVQIGSVLLNTKTNKVVKFLDDETEDVSFKAEYSSRWLSPDPLAEKYPQLSPYVFCMNNPVNIIDPTGKEIWLTMYGENGRVSEKMLYTQGMEYRGQNEFFKKSVSTLNKMNSEEAGSAVLNTLSSSENKYYYTNLVPEKGSAATTKPNDDASGGYFLMGKNASLENTAHELFHGYQIEKGVGGRSVTNEVEAYAFGYSIAYNYATDHYTTAESQEFLNQSTNMGQNNFLGKLYNDSFKSLLTGNASNTFANYTIAIAAFKGGALVNSRGLYNDYSIQLPNRNKGLLFSFLPLIK